MPLKHAGDCFFGGSVYTCCTAKSAASMGFVSMELHLKKQQPVKIMDIISDMANRMPKCQSFFCIQSVAALTCYSLTMFFRKYSSPGSDRVIQCGLIGESEQVINRAFDYCL